MNDIVIDNSALERLRKIGGESFLKQMIDLFLSDAAAKQEAAVNGCKEEDWDSVEQAVHSLKSSSGNVGAVELQELSDEIESLIRQEDPEKVPDLVNQLSSVFKIVIESLKEIREGLI